MTITDYVFTWLMFSGGCFLFRAMTGNSLLWRKELNTPRQLVFGGVFWSLVDMITAPLWLAWSIFRGIVTFAVWLWRNDPAT